MAQVLTLSGSTLYGATPQGGSNSDGVLFSVNTDGSNFTLLRTFSGATTDGSEPTGALSIIGSQIYGMTKAGGSFGAGAAYVMNLDGSGFTILHNFGTGGSSDGDFPVGSMTPSGSKLYGMTSLGGIGSKGTIFSMNPDGSGYTTLYSFTGGATSGVSPRDGTLAISGSMLYGMAFQGGSANNGIVFGMNLDGSGFTVLHSFTRAIDGSGPLGSLLLVGSQLYGLMPGGGPSVGGLAFSMNLDGSDFTQLHNFSGKGGTFPDGSLTLLGTKLFGTTSGGGANTDGTVFEMNLDGSDFTLLSSFTGQPGDGNDPEGSVTVSPDGSVLYGMTRTGGTSNDGTVFSVAIPAPEPASAGLIAYGALLMAGLRRRRQEARR